MPTTNVPKINVPRINGPRIDGPRVDGPRVNGNSTNDDLRRARSSVAEAELAQRPSDRYLAAHLAALRVVAIVLTHRAHRGLGPATGRPRNAWRMLAEVAPELAEWAAFFAATEGKRDAIRAGATSIVSAREADDLVRDARAFLRLVERAVGFSAVREPEVDVASR